jgi:hypothetical protein
MPIPELSEYGLLPEGIHDCTLEEIGARFGRFQKTDRRVQLFTKLCALVQEEQRAGIAIEIFIDGSFVTDKATPGDIDLVLVVPAEYRSGGDLPPFRYNAISKQHLRQRYQFDVFVARQNSSLYNQQLDFFQHDSRLPSGNTKGILRIKL